MAQPRFTLYKHIKVGRTWRYCRAAVAVNNKVKPHIVVVGGTEAILSSNISSRKSESLLDAPQ